MGIRTGASAATKPGCKLVRLGGNCVWGSCMCDMVTATSIPYATVCPRSGSMGLRPTEAYSLDGDLRHNDRYAAIYNVLLYGAHRLALVIVVLPHEVLALNALQVPVVVVASGPSNSAVAAVWVGALRGQKQGRAVALLVWERNKDGALLQKLVLRQQPWRNLTSPVQQLSQDFLTILQTQQAQTIHTVGCHTRCMFAVRVNMLPA